MTEPMTYAHDAHCNVIHTPGPEPCPPHCDDEQHITGQPCPSCGTVVKTRDKLKLVSWGPSLYGLGEIQAVRKASAFTFTTPDDVADANVLRAGLDALFATVTDPNYVAPPPWEGPPVTPEPAGYRLLLAATEEPIVREVIELHGPKWSYIRADGTCDWRCEGCEIHGYDAEYPDWPCETTAVIARHLGVSLEATA